MPTALNKHGNRVELDGHSFDSEKEAAFYERFVKECGYRYEVHPRFILASPKTLAVGKTRQHVYTPDFVIYGEYGNMLHVYDVKNSFGAYGIDSGAKERFAWFTMLWHIPVEAVVVRKHSFRVIAQGVTKMRKITEPFVTDNLDYDWKEATRY